MVGVGLSGWLGWCVRAVFFLLKTRRDRKVLEPTQEYGTDSHGHIRTIMQG